jgi:hypothetical protein
MASGKGERINLVGKIVMASDAKQSHRQNCHCEERSDAAIS